MTVPTAPPDPWWTHPDLKWWSLLAIFLGCGFFFYAMGDRGPSAAAFWMAAGQAATAGLTAVRKPA